MKATPEIVLETVCKYYSLTKKEIASKTKERPFVSVRHIYFYLCRKHTKSSYKYIGSLVNRDHATVIYAFRKFNGYLTKEEKAEIDFLSSILENDTSKSNDFTTMFCNLGRFYQITKGVDFYYNLKNIKSYESEIITTKEAAEILCVVGSTVAKLRNKGLFKNIGTKSQPKYYRDEIIKAKKKHRTI